MTSRDKEFASVDIKDPRRGRFDPARVGKPNPRDKEERPAVTAEDTAATRAELGSLKRRMTRKSA